ncbi:hypothetical protein N7476_004715 [Penicillium atrosanguineum]|uniref:Uncharacterized protein n=1 Tax=Penicillium atrosanguineum TaxID=1132637 RepID=A0A9W9U5F7_9EURO|nr:hypothetical protein N7476_004715 [Penicillium atrosanguineum]
MAGYRPPTPSPNFIDMDVSEILRTIAALNTRCVRAEKIIAKHEHDLGAARQSLAQTSNELDETVKVAELLYDVNRRLGTVTDYLLAQHGMALSDGEPKSVEVLINSMVNQTGAEAPPSFERNGNMAADKGFPPTELTKGCRPPPEPTSCLNEGPSYYTLASLDTSMASPRSVLRAQSLTRKLQLALANVRPVPSEQETLASHGGLLPSAMEEHDVEEDRMRRSRAPSPDDMCPMKALGARSNDHQENYHKTERPAEKIHDWLRSAHKLILKLSCHRG